MSASLSLDNPGNTVFLRPENSASQIISGTLTLRLKKDRQIKRISVRLLSELLCYRNGTCMNQAPEILLDRCIALPSGFRLPAGEHYFPFSFRIASTSAPSDATASATIRQRIQADISCAGLGNDFSAHLPLFFVACPPGDGNLPDDYFFACQDYSEDLGPYAMDIACDSLTVSSLMAFKLQFHCPPQDVQVNSLRAFIKQSTDIVRTEGYGQQEELVIFDMTSLPPPQTILKPLPRIRYDTLVTTLKARERNDQLSGFARLPCHRTLRPSTQELADTPLRISHSLVLQIKYTLPSGVARMLRLERNININSCTLVPLNVLLPPYSEKQDLPISRHEPWQCKCKLDDQQLCLQILGLDSYIKPPSIDVKA